jgi:hypothetical protein
MATLKEEKDAKNLRLWAFSLKSMAGNNSVEVVALSRLVEDPGE